jgi:hypothetical protein
MWPGEEVASVGNVFTGVGLSSAYPAALSSASRVGALLILKTVSWPSEPYFFSAVTVFWAETR